MNFYGYTVRATREADLALAVAWTPRALDARFWLKQDEGRGIAKIWELYL